MIDIDRDKVKEELAQRLEKEAWVQIPMALLGAYMAAQEGGEAYKSFRQGEYGKGALHLGLAGANAVFTPFTKAVTWLPKMWAARKFMAAGQSMAPKATAEAGKAASIGAKMFGGAAESRANALSKTVHGDIRNNQLTQAMYNRAAKAKLPFTQPNTPVTPALVNARSQYKQSVKGWNDFDKRWTPAIQNKVPGLAQLAIMGGPGMVFPSLYSEGNMESQVADNGEAPSMDPVKAPSQPIHKAPSRYNHAYLSELKARGLV